MSAHLPKPSVSLWRDAAFLRLFIANTLSALGSAVSLMALPLTAVGMLHANASQMGVLAACELLPFIIVGLPAGVWIDRASKKRLTVLFNFVAALGLGLVPLCWLLGCLQIEVLYSVGFVASTCEAIGGSASQVLVTLMFGRERLVEANSKLSVAGSVSQICGPALGALLVAAFGAPLAVTADALSFVVAGVLIGRIAVQEKAGTRSRASMLVQIREGLKLVWHTPMLRGLIVVVAVWILLSDSFKALYVLYASRNLGLGAAAIGLINMLGALGGLLGAPLADRLSQRHGMRLTLLGGVALAGVGYLAYALPQVDWPLTSLWAGLALFVYNLGGTVYVVNYLSLRGCHARPDARADGDFNALCDNPARAFRHDSDWPFGGSLRSASGVCRARRGLHQRCVVGRVLLAAAMVCGGSADPHAGLIRSGSARARC